MFGIRKTLRIGASVFGLSALLLLFMPKLFLDLLNMESRNTSLVWSMEMIGITLVALAGNMWVNSKNSDPSSVKKVGLVMAVCATALGVLTLLIPVSMGWFAIAYAVVGFAFGANYSICIVRKKY